MTDWELRPATEADKEFLRELHRTTLREYVDQVFGWDDDEQRAFFDERWDPRPQQVIRVEGRDAGALHVEVRDDEVFLANIGLLPEYQSRGIGSRVIQSVLDDARARGLPVSLSVLRPNPARRLYERLGFAVVEESPERFTLRWSG